MTDRVDTDRIRNFGADLGDGDRLCDEVDRLRAIEDAARKVDRGWGPGVGQTEEEWVDACKALRDALEAHR